MFNRTTDGSLDNEAVKIVSALKPFWKKWTDEWGRNCVRSKKMTVTTAPSVVTGLIGVTDAFSDTECMIPYKGDVALAQAGDTVWVKWMYDNQQTMYAECMGNIVKPVGTSDSTPYFYRPSGGGSLGAVNREKDKLIGGTIAWNQLADAFRATTTIFGLTITKTGDYTGTVSGTINATASFKLSNGNVAFVANHKYFIGIGTALPSGFYIVIGGIGTQKRADFIYANSNDQTVTVDLHGQSGSSIDVKISLCVIDLTAMFGSTIANYAYTLESNTAGSGIAWLKSYGFFTKPYYPYAAANLQSVKTSAHRMVGFNRFDKAQMGDGYISNNTGAVGGTNTSKHTDYIRVIGGSSYYIKTDATSGKWGAWYDANKTFISGISGDGAKTAPNDACYMRYTVVNNNNGNPDTFCINLSKTTGSPKNGDYVPYVAHEYALSDITLRGILKLDASNKLYYDGDEYASDGTVTRKYGIVDLGTLTWSNGSTSQSGVYRKTATLAGAKIAADASVVANIVCTKYLAVSALQTYRVEAVGISININAAQVMVYDPNYNASTDIAAFTTAMSGVYLVYELATPTTETADPYTNPQVVDASGTEQYVDASYTAGTRDFEMPVGHDTEYYVLQSFEQQIYDTPKTDGTYRLICKVVNGEASLEWIRDDVTVV